MAPSRVLGVCFSVSPGECLIYILECVCIHPSVFSACTYIHLPKIREDTGQDRQWASWSWSGRQGLGYLSPCSGPCLPCLILHSNSLSHSTSHLVQGLFTTLPTFMSFFSGPWHVLSRLAKMPFILSLLKDACSSFSKVQRPRNTLWGGIVLPICCRPSPRSHSASPFIRHIKL